MSYEILDHTADEKFRATGGSKEEALEESVKAFAEIADSDPKAGEVRHSIDVESENMEALLYDFLHRLIMIQETENVVVCKADTLTLEETEKGFRIKADIWTDPIRPGMSLTDIKAPTYNEMKIDYEKGTGWVIEAVLDI